MPGRAWKGLAAGAVLGAWLGLGTASLLGAQGEGTLLALGGGLAGAGLAAWAEQRRQRRLRAAREELLAALAQAREGTVPAGYGESPEAEELWSRVADLAQAVAEGHRCRARLQALLEGMFEAGMLLDARQRILRVSRVAASLFGVPAEEALGQHHLGLTRDRHLDRLVQEARRRARQVEGEWRLARVGEGEPRTLETAAVPVGAPAEGEVWVVGQDVTRLRRLERIRTDFVANLSHEIRTPLTAIAGFAEMLLQPDLDLTTVQHFSRVISEEAGRLTRLLDRLLDLSRLELGEDRPRRVLVDLSALAAEAASRFFPRAEEAGLTLDVVTEAPVWVEADPDHMTRVLFNLLDNAVKYTPAGGRVEVRVGEEGDKAVLAVVDTGQGIPLQELDRIFERFYRVDKDRSRASGGAGLGLAIVKHLVQLQGGDISVASRVGHGSRFTVTLPKAGPREGMGDPDGA